MRYLLTLSLLICLFTNLLAQPETNWAKTYGVEGYPEKLIRSENGGYLMCGTRWHQIDDDYFSDAFLMKVDQDGDSLWYKTYGDSGEWFLDMTELSNGNLVAVGTTEELGENGSDMFVICTDEDGDSLWSYTFGLNGYDWASAVCEGEDGGVYVLGTVNRRGDISNDFCLIELDTDGDSLWSKYYGGDGDQSTSAAIRTSNDGFIVTGRNGRTPIAMKIDSAGDSVWTVVFAYDGNSKGFTSVIETSNGGFAFGGYLLDSDSDEYSYLLTVIDEDGEVDLEREYIRGYPAQCLDILECPDGGFSLLGFGRGDYCTALWLLRTDEEGDSLWSFVYEPNGHRHPRGNSMLMTDDGAYVIAGSLQGYGGSGVMLIETEIDPLLIQFGWNDLPAVEFNEDHDCQINVDSLLTYLESPYPAELSAIQGEHVYPLVINDTILIYSNINWNGTDSLLLIATIEQASADTAYLVVNVNPTNDLPQEFSLLTPEDESDIDDPIFRWRKAVQNDWELDEVRYNLNFSISVAELETNASVENIIDTVYTFDSISALAALLDLDLQYQGYNVEWYVEAHDDSGFTESQQFKFHLPSLDVIHENGNDIPSKYELYPAYPNPFNSTLNIAFGLPTRGEITIKLYDILGCEIHTILAGNFSAGNHIYQYDVGKLPSGQYIMQFIHQDGILSQKVVLIR